MNGMQITSTAFVAAQNGADWNIIHHQYGLPVILDLDRNGVDVTTLGASAASFDMNGDGAREHTAWAGRNDGILAIDLGQGGASGPDGVIDRPGKSSSARGLRHDIRYGGAAPGVRYQPQRRARRRDARWSEFRVGRMPTEMASRGRRSENAGAARHRVDRS